MGIMKDEMKELANNLWQIAHAINDQNFTYGKDATGGTINCLTDSIMGVTAGLVAVARSNEAIAEAISNGLSELAEAIKESKQDQ
jgi:hypothetical protein